jgi:hypothetical protein
MSQEPASLICMPLGEMHKRHPDQIHRTCSNCGVLVGIYPSGQKAIKAYPQMKIICINCATDKIDPTDEFRPAGPIEEIKREIGESFEVKENKNE